MPSPKPQYTPDEANALLEAISKGRYTFQKILIWRYGIPPSKQKISCKCIKCGYRFETPFGRLKGCVKQKPQGCPYCAGNKKLSNREKYDRLLKLSKDRYTFELLGDANVSKQRVRCKCLICNYEWKTNFGALVSQKTGCPYCGLKKARAATRYRKDK